MSDDLIPLATLSWSPSTGWPADLIVVDRVGRECLTQSVAEDLFAKHREQMETAARKRSELERLAVERDQAFRASLPRGVPVGAVPEGISAGMLMMLSDPDRQGSRRVSVLEHALADRDGAAVFHQIGTVEGGTSGGGAS